MYAFCRREGFRRLCLRLTVRLPAEDAAAQIKLYFLSCIHP
jgi:hypothetical protein